VRGVWLGNEGDYAPIYFRSNKNQDCPPPSEAAPLPLPPERSGEEEGVGGGANIRFLEI